MKKKKTVNLHKTFISGSRIPISIALDYFKAGYTLTYFIRSYPWLKKEDVIKKIEEVKKEHAASLYVS